MEACPDEASNQQVPEQAAWGFASTPSLGDVAAAADSEVAALLAAAEAPREPPASGSVDQFDSEHDRPASSSQGPICRRPTRLHSYASSSSYACAAFTDALAESRTYRSPACEASMAEALGVAHLYDGLLGSGISPLPGKSLEQLRGVLRTRINSAWSLEATKQGVAHAKQGTAARILSRSSCQRMDGSRLLLNAGGTIS